MTSAISVPLRDAGQVVGAVNVESTGEIPLTEADLRLLEAVSKLVELALGRARHYAEARSSEALFRSAFDHAPIGMALVTRDGRWARVNQALTAMLGCEEAELLATTVAAMADADDRVVEPLRHRLLAGEDLGHPVEARFRHRAGHPIWVQLSVSAVGGDAEPGYFVYQIEDITERKRLQARLHQMALHDGLTLLPNRVFFLDRLDQALTGASRQRAGNAGSPAVLFVDLDGFKSVNDSHGHETGDRLLAAVAERLSVSLRPNDSLARYGGDEFAVLVEELTDAAAVRVAERIIEALRAPFTLAGHEVFVSASVGIAFGRPGETAHELMRRADVALYQAKGSGRATFAVFAPERPTPVAARLDRAAALRRAIEQDALQLRFQPEVDLSSGAVIALDATVVWEDADRPATIAAADLFRLAEESGVAVALGRWVLWQVCRQGAIWQAEFGGATPALGVNLGPRQLRQPTIVGELASLLDITGFAPRLLRLGIDERLLSEPGIDFANRLDDLKSLGISLALDHFGTGPAMLSALRGLPLDAVATTPHLVQSLDERGGQAILRALTNLAHDLAARLIATGVATPAQMAALRALRVDGGRGPLFSPPLTADAVTELYRTASPGAAPHLLTLPAWSPPDAAAPQGHPAPEPPAALAAT